MVLIGAGYFLRLTTLPVLGEEGRRARGAINMLETGDWTVVRQQGVVFPDRPPMTNWLIALVALAGNGVDTLAIRLPSALAILALTLLIYAYCRRLLSRLTAIAAAAVFATSGQVIQLGRSGESEAVFTLFVAASLLLWHLGFAAGWPRAWTWSLGYASAALGALVKGLQPPVYFVMVVGAFLIWKRHWRWLFGWQHAVGLAVFTAIVAAWQVPYSLATDTQSSLDTWFDVVTPRLWPAGLLEHVATYPLETFVALLPWSLVLPALALPGIRRGLLERREHLAFVIVALVVTYPTVWFAAGALPRYYMPLYPCVAILVGALLDNLATASLASSRRRLWRGFLAVAASLAVIFGGLAGLVWLLEHEKFVALRQSPPLTALLLIAASLAVGAALRARSRSEPRAARVALFSLAIFFGLVDSTLRTSLRASRRQDLTPLVAAVRAAVLEPDRLVSFSPVDPRFTYHYRHLIPELPWPTELSDLPPDVDYFCFDRRPTDTAASRYAERGMKFWSTPGTLPFAWEEIARVGVGPKIENPPSVAVIVGRVLRTADGEPIPAAGAAHRRP